MNLVTVSGEAEEKFDADLCDIFLNVFVEDVTAAKASKACGDRCETLIEKLCEEGVEARFIEISEDSIDRNSRYGKDPDTYESERTLVIHAAADTQMLNLVRSIIEDDFANVLLTCKYSLSNRSEIQKDLMIKAIEDSRAKAEIMAETVGCSVMGIDEANLSGNENRTYTGCSISAFDYAGARAARDLSSRRHTNLLKPEQIKLSASVRIVWRIE